MSGTSNKRQKTEKRNGVIINSTTGDNENTSVQLAVSVCGLSADQLRSSNANYSLDDMCLLCRSKGINCLIGEHTNNIKSTSSGNVDEIYVDHPEFSQIELNHTRSMLSGSEMNRQKVCYLIFIQ